MFLTYVGVLIITALFILVGGVTSSQDGWAAIVMAVVIFGPLAVDIAAWTRSVHANGDLSDRITVISSAAWTVFGFFILVIAQKLELERLADLLGAFLITGRLAFTGQTIKAWVTSWRSPERRDSPSEREARRAEAKAIREHNASVLHPQRSKNN